MSRVSAWVLFGCMVLCNCAPSLPDETADVLATDAATTNGDAAAHGDSSDSENAATYANVRALFADRCSGYCHAGGSSVGASLVLAPESGAVPAIVNRPSRQVPRLMIVAPGDPESSYLVRKIEGTMSELPECTGAMNPCGIPMPYAYINDHPAVTMSSTQREMIRQWILDGALVPES